jgi:PAS domain S-box-containing protein
LVIIELIYGLSLLVAIIVLSGFIDERFDRKELAGKIFQGLLFGTAALIGMLNPFELEKGLFFDGRTIVISLCTFFFGPLPGIISLLPALLYRISVGGIGIYMGIGTIVSSFLIGYFYHRQRSPQKTIDNIHLYLFGLLVHIVMLLLITTLPSVNIISTYKALTFAILLIYPMISLVISKILLDQEQKKIAFHTIKQNEKLYRTTLYSIGDAVITTDIDGIIQQMNPIAEQLTGRQESEAKNCHLDEVFTIYNEETKLRIESPLKSILTTGAITVLSNSTLLVSKDGKEIPIADSGAPIIDENEKIIGIVLIFRNQTIEKEKQRLITESETRLKRAEFIAKAGNWEIDLRTGLIHGSEGAQKLYGVLSNDWKLSEIQEIPLPEYREMLNNTLANLIKNNDPYDVEFKIKRSDGQILFIHSVAEYDKENKKVFGVIEDITEKKLIEIKLKEDEELFRTISSLTSDYLFSTGLDSNGNLVHHWVGGAFDKLTGYSIEEFRKIGGWRARLHPDDHEKDDLAMQKLFNNENVVTETRTIHRNGNIVWARIYAKPIWDYESNKLIGVNGAVQDITEKKQSQLIQQIQFNIANAITSSIKTAELFSMVRKELSQLMDTKNFFVAFYDPETGMLIADLDKDEKDVIGSWPAGKSLTGYLLKSKKTLLLTKNEIIELSDKGLIELVGTLPEIWLGSPLRIGDKVIGAVVVQSYDDPYAYDEASQKIFGVIANQLSLYIQRKKAEEEVSILASAIHQTPLSIVVTDTIGKIVYVNPSFSKATGYSKEEIIGQNTRILGSKHHNKEFYKNLWSTILDGKDWEGEILNKNKKGELYWEHQIISPVINDDGIATHFVAIKEDVTEKKKMIEEIIKAKEKAETSEKLKTEFLAQISHEIRTPINIMTSNVQLIKDEVEDKIDEEYQEVFSSISRASHRIIRTIDLILNMAELQTGAYRPIMKKINLDSDILQSLYLEYLHLAKNKNLNLEYKCLLDESIITVDEYSTMQIFANLIDNSIKYTDEGKIEIILLQNDEDEIIVEIKDTGIGMSSEFLDKIFEPFVQEERGYTRSFDGNGLGLALVKNYCEINNASIEVQSEKNAGSNFRVTFKK